MSLNLHSGARCFVDANILFYYFVHHPQFSPPVANWMKRVVVGDLFAGVTAPVVADALHRVMIAEVQMVYAKPKALSYLKDHPHVISTLRAYPQAIQTALSLPLQLLDMEGALLQDLAGLSGSCQLMTNDSLIVASMRRHGIPHLATNDNDFDNLPGITVWKPR
jgi:predicted nucleic acid-binding protein